MDNREYYESQIYQMLRNTYDQSDQSTVIFFVAVYNGKFGRRVVIDIARW